MKGQESLSRCGSGEQREDRQKTLGARRLTVAEKDRTEQALVWGPCDRGPPREHFPWAWGGAAWLGTRCRAPNGDSRFEWAVGQDLAGAQSQVD